MAGKVPPTAAAVSVAKSALKIAPNKAIRKNEGNVTQLHIACQKRHLEVVQSLLAAGEDVNQAGPDGVTPLWIAAGYGHLEVVQELLVAEANVDQPHNDGGTPLFMAAGRGHLEIVRRLLSAGGDLNKATMIGTTPLFMAAYNGHADVVQALIAAGANVDQPHNDGATLLFIAAQRGHLEVVRRLLSAGGDVDQARTSDGVTPLLMAAGSGHLDVVGLLLNAGANINEPSNGGITPLLMAAGSGHLDVVRLLLNAGGDLNKATMIGTTPLLIAAKNGHLECVRFLVADLKSNLNTQQLLNELNKEGPEGGSPIWQAAQLGHVDVVQALLTAGADPDQARASDRATPLLMAARNGHPEVVVLLLKNKANVNQPGPNGVTPLWMAALKGQTAVAELLLNNKANVDQPDNNGAIPFLIATAKGHVEIVRILITNGGDVNQAGPDGATPLQMAAQNGHTEVTKLLLTYGAAKEGNAVSMMGIDHKNYNFLLKHRETLNKLSGVPLTVDAIQKDGNGCIFISQEINMKNLSGDTFTLPVKIFDQRGKLYVICTNDNQDHFAGLGLNTGQSILFAQVNEPGSHAAEAVASHGVSVADFAEATEAFGGAAAVAAVPEPRKDPIRVGNEHLKEFMLGQRPILLATLTPAIRKDKKTLIINYFYDNPMDDAKADVAKKVSVIGTEQTDRDLLTQYSKAYEEIKEEAKKTNRWGKGDGRQPYKKAVRERFEKLGLNFGPKGKKTFTKPMDLEHHTGGAAAPSKNTPLKDLERNSTC